MGTRWQLENYIHNPCEGVLIPVKASTGQWEICLPSTQLANSVSWWVATVSPQRRWAWPLLVSPRQRCYLHQCIPRKGCGHLKKLISSLSARPTALLRINHSKGTPSGQILPLHIVHMLTVIFWHACFYLLGHGAGHVPTVLPFQVSPSGDSFWGNDCQPNANTHLRTSRQGLEDSTKHLIVCHAFLAEVLV